MPSNETDQLNALTSLFFIWSEFHDFCTYCPCSIKENRTFGEQLSMKYKRSTAGRPRSVALVILYRYGHLYTHSFNSLFNGRELQKLTLTPGLIRGIQKRFRMSWVYPLIYHYDNYCYLICFGLLLPTRVDFDSN